jgi:hypothetical protein
VTLGSDTGKGGFFPEGVNGRINSTAGFNSTANVWGGYPGSQVRLTASVHRPDRICLSDDVS